MRLCLLASFCIWFFSSQTLRDHWFNIIKEFFTLSAHYNHYHTLNVFLSFSKRWISTYKYVRSHPLRIIFRIPIALNIYFVVLPHCPWRCSDSSRNVSWWELTWSSSMLKYYVLEPHELLNFKLFLAFKLIKYSILCVKILIQTLLNDKSWTHLFIMLSLHMYCSQHSCQSTWMSTVLLTSMKMDKGCRYVCRSRWTEASTDYLSLYLPDLQQH